MCILSSIGSIMIQPVVFINQFLISFLHPAMSIANPYSRRRLPIDIASPRLQDSQVILILGEPSLADLHTLLTSYYFDLSLLVIATHNPLDIPNAILQSPTGPDVRVLCMSKPLALDEKSGSVRLVSLLERAGIVVKAWRDLQQCPLSPSPSPRHASSSDRNRIVHLSESTPGGEFSMVVVEPFKNVHDKEHKPSRQPSSSAATNSRRSYSCFGTTSLSTSSLPAHTCTRSKTHPNHLHHRRSQSEFKPTTTPFNFATSSSQRQPPSFNAILNFSPAGLSEKVLLKQTILVTTLCSPYLSDVEAHRYSNSNDVTREPPSAASEGDPTNNRSESGVGRAPNYYRRTASSSLQNEITTNSNNNRRSHRFSTLSFLSSTSQGSANSSINDSKPTWTHRLSHLLGNSPPAAGRSDVELDNEISASNGTRQPAESVSLYPGPHKREAKRRRPNNAHLVHILPKHWVVPAEEGEAAAKTQNTPLARHRTLTVPSPTVSGGGRSGSAALRDTNRRRKSMPVRSLLPASSSSSAFVHARVQGSLLRRATLLHNAHLHHALMSKKTRPRGPHSISIRHELASPSSRRDKPKLAEHMCQFLSDYYLAGSEQRVSTSMSGSVVVPYVMASGCLGEDGIQCFPNRLASGDDDKESRSRKMTIGELVLLGALDLAHCGRNCRWIGGVDDLVDVHSDSQEKTKTRAAGIEGGHYYPRRGPEKQEPEIVIIQEPRFPPPVAVPCLASSTSSTSSSGSTGPPSSRSSESRRADRTSLSLDVEVSIPEAVHFPTGSFELGSPSIVIGRRDGASNSSSVGCDGRGGDSGKEAAAAAGVSAKVVVVTSGSSRVPVVPSPLTVSRNREREWRKGFLTMDGGGGGRFAGKLRRWSWGIFAVKADTTDGGGNLC